MSFKKVEKPVEKVGEPEMLWKVHSLADRLESIKHIERGDCLKYVYYYFVLI